MTIEIFAFLGMGGTELMVVLGAVLLLFGPKKLPELARGLGKGIREFKKASNEVTEELERTMDDYPDSKPHFSATSTPEEVVPHKKLNEPSSSAITEHQQDSAENSPPK